MKKLGLSEEDIHVPSINDIVLKAAQDAYFKIFETVLSDPRVIKRSMSPLDKDDMKIMASESMIQKSNRPFVDPMRQMSDYSMQANSKTGLAMLSRMVTAFASMSGKGLKFISEDGSDAPFSRFANSDGSPLSLLNLDPNAESKFLGNIKRSALVS